MILQNNYGNLCQRVFSFIKKIVITRSPRQITYLQNDEKLIQNIKINIPKLIDLINQTKFK